jgi:hypothetical protein
MTWRPSRGFVMSLVFGVTYLCYPVLGFTS